MQSQIPRYFWLLALLSVAQAEQPVTELEFSPSSVNLTAESDYASNKARLLRLSNAVLVSVWQEGVGAPTGAWGPDGVAFAPRDIMLRVSGDGGQTWNAPINVSNTAALTDPAAFYNRTGDGGGLAAFFGDSGKPSVVATGNDVALAWNDTWCGEGMHGPARYETEAGTIEVPYRCLYVARVSVSPEGATVMAVEQMTDAKRDVMNEVIRATGGGFAAAWQEDPAGLQLGEARGGGHGLSGARASSGTDIWYAWISKAEFADPISPWHGPVAITNNYHYPSDSAVEGGASRPGLFLAGSPVQAILVYEEAKFVGPEDRGKYVRFHAFPFDDPPDSDAGIIISAPDENARRARVMAASTPGPGFGTRLLLMWRQGEGIQGAPADFMMRIGAVAVETDTSVEPNAGFRVQDLWPAVDSIDPGNNEPALNISGAALSDASSVDPDANAMAHRAVMSGDFIYVGYTQDPAVSDGVDEFRYYLRWSADGGSTWSAPAEPNGGAVVAGNIIEPRLIRTPGTVNSGKPEDIRNPDVYVLAWGTEIIPAGETEPVRDALFVTRTMDRGLTFEPVQALATSRTSADQTDEQIQLRASPDGQQVHAVWLRRDAQRSDVIFSSAVGIVRTADLAVAMTTDNVAPDIGVPVPVNLSVSNHGPQAATELQLTVDIPAGLSVTAATTAAGTCDIAGNVDCDLDQLDPGDTVAVELTVMASQGGRRTLIAEVAAREEEPQPPDNRAELDIEAVPKADVGLAELLHNAQILVGEEFSIGLHVANRGPQPATGVAVIIELPAHAILQDGSPCAVEGDLISCSLPDLAEGEFWSQTIIFRATSAGEESITMTATAEEVDPDDADNSATVAFSISAPEPVQATISRSAGSGGCVYAPNGNGDFTLILLLALTLAWRLHKSLLHESAQETTT